MKRSILIVLFTVGSTSLFTSCNENGASSENLRIGTLAGTVWLYNQYGQSIGSEAGLIIDVQGKTEHTATTSSDGRWKIENMLAGTYNITCSKEGYATSRISGYGFLGRGEQSPDTIRIARLPSWTIPELRVEFRDSIGLVRDSVLTDLETGTVSLRRDTLELNLDTLRPVLFGRSSEKSPFGSYSYIQVFLGLDESVSSSSFIGFAQGEFSERDEFVLLIEPALKRSVAERGDRIYLVAYPLAPWGSILTDQETGKRVDTRLGDNKSNVISFIW